MTQVVNPPLVQHGFVQGRFVTAIADTLDDEDRYPDLRGVEGSVRFVPVTPIHMTEGAHRATVIKQPVVVPVNSNGYMVDVSSQGDPNAVPGVWLAVGRYEVRTVFNNVATSPQFSIEVTDEHTLENPLHLTDAAPIVLPPQSVEVTRVIDRILAQQAAAEAMSAASVAAQDAAALVRSEVSADALTASTSATQATAVKGELEALFLGGTEAVNDAAISAFVGTEGTATKGALSKSFASQVRVTAYGNNVGEGDSAVDTAAFIAALDAARPIGAEVVFPSGKSYRIGTVGVIGGEKIYVEAGAEMVAVATNGLMIVGGGELSTTSTTSAGVTEGAITVSVASASGLAVGDTILTYSNSNLVTGTTSKRGYLRRIRSISGSTLTVDGPWPLSLSGDVVVNKVNMAAPIEIRGEGRVRGSDPLGTQDRALFDLRYVDSPILDGLQIGPAGGTAQKLSSCIGGWTNVDIRDLSNFGSHYGYAVDWAGATRGHAIVGGSAKRVRHGVSTNGAASQLGEPEANVALPAYVISECADAGMDTHAHGVGNALLATVVNCAIGVQDRATRTIMGGTVSGASLYGYHVMSTSVGAMLINPVVLNMGTGSGTAAFRLRAECEIESPVYPVATAVAVNADADYTVRGGGLLAGSTTGAGVRKHALLGRSAVTPSGTTDIKQALVDLGVLASGSAALGSGVTNIVASAVMQGRFLRGVATSPGDIAFRADGASGATADLAQFRVNGVNQVRVGANGELEVHTASAGLVLKSPNGLRHRVTVTNAGELSVSPA